MTKQNGRQPVELVGEVWAVALSHDGDGGGAFKMRLDNGDTIPANFVAEQAPAVICALREHGECRLKIVGLGDFSPSGQLQRVLRIDDHRLEWIRPPEDPDEPPLLDKLLAIANSIPDEALAKIPTDFSANYKHYMYGWPKREEEESE